MSLTLEKGLGMGTLSFSIYVKLCQKHKNSCTGSNGGSISTFPFPAVYFGSLRGQEQDAKQGFRCVLCPTFAELYLHPTFID